MALLLVLLKAWHSSWLGGVAILESTEELFCAKNGYLIVNKSKFPIIAFSPPTAVKWWYLFWVMYWCSPVLNHFLLLDCFVLSSLCIVAADVTYYNYRAVFPDGKHLRAIKCKCLRWWVVNDEHTDVSQIYFMYFFVALMSNWKSWFLFLVWQKYHCNVVHEVSYEIV